MSYDPILTREVSSGKNWKLVNGDAFNILGSFWHNPIDLCFTSPSPYKFKDQPYGIGSEKTVSDYLENLISLSNRVRDVLTPKGNFCVNMVDGYNPDIGGMLFIPERFSLMMLQKGWLCKSKIVWQRPYHQEMYYGKRFRSDWEYVYCFSRDYDPYIEHHGYTHTSVFQLPTQSGVFDGAFPEHLMKIIIRTCCPENGLVLDPLCGTGATGAVALREGRRFVGIEILKEKYDTAKVNLDNTV